MIHFSSEAQQLYQVPLCPLALMECMNRKISSRVIEQRVIAAGAALCMCLCVPVLGANCYCQCHNKSTGLLPVCFPAKVKRTLNGCRNIWCRGKGLMQNHLEARRVRKHTHDPLFLLFATESTVDDFQIHWCCSPRNDQLLFTGTISLAVPVDCCLQSSHSVYRTHMCSG